MHLVNVCSIYNQRYKKLSCYSRRNNTLNCNFQGAFIHAIPHIHWHHVFYGSEIEVRGTQKENKEKLMRESIKIYISGGWRGREISVFNPSFHN